MVVNAPERSLQQRRDALVKANDIRVKRKHLKWDLKAGRVNIHDLIMDPPDMIHTMKLFELMLTIPKYGRVKVNKILTQCRISADIEALPFRKTANRL